MSGFKGTQAPWDAGTEVPIKALFCERAGMSIVFRNSWREEDEIEAQSNVYLISAAPELLEALEEIVSAADGDGWNQLDADLRKARAAIAKALGEE